MVVWAEMLVVEVGEMVMMEVGVMGGGTWVKLAWAEARGRRTRRVVERVESILADGAVLIMLLFFCMAWRKRWRFALDDLHDGGFTSI
jgi:hypothetical protein